MNSVKSSLSAWRQACAAALIVALQVPGLAQAADLSAQMANMFGNGALANVTGPGAYRSQSQNIYMGGEMQIRFPTRNYQIWSYQLPHISAGCGGVDLFLGSLSHIRSDQFKQMLENVAQAYQGLLFKAALKAINPLMESVIGDVQNTLEKWSSFNANSCQMAQYLVNKTSEYTGMTSELSCKDMAMRIWGEDDAAASKRCKINQAETNAAAKASADPAIRALADRDMNMVWEALRNTTMNTDEKTVFMNIAGTLVIRKPSNNGDIPQTIIEHGPGVDSLRQLLFGDEHGENDQKVKLVNWLQCKPGSIVGSPGDCLDVVRGPIEIRPFPTEVRVILEGLRTSITSRTALTAAQIAFVNQTSVPVLRMLSVGYKFDSGTRTDDLIDTLIHRYAKVIAYDYAHVFLRKGLKDLRVFLGMVKKQNDVEEKQAARMIANVDRLLDEIDREHQKAKGEIQQANAVIDDLQRIERQYRHNLPGNVRGMLDMQNLMRGAGG